ncbi:stalk domain-containing protein [Tepidanaerobacter syntrophicus]|uniref:stalk domain-containing protein n=1 Tax=Tepidanaerobacter syntrophicus TaxID=224999 RepID=UPI001BD1E67F
MFFSGEVRKNGEPVFVPVSPRLINGTFYVPLRFVAENLGVTASTQGDGSFVFLLCSLFFRHFANHTVKITSKVRQFICSLRQSELLIMN